MAKSNDAPCCILSSNREDVASSSYGYGCNADACWGNGAACALLLILNSTVVMKMQMNALFEHRMIH